MNLHRMFKARAAAPHLGRPLPVVADPDRTSSFVFLNSRPAILS